MSDAEAGNKLARWDALLGISAEREAVAELERLRVINADLRLMIDGLETAAHEERSAVVAWLRSDAFIQHWQQELGRLMCDVAADGIERGEHRREEER